MLRKVTLRRANRCGVPSARWFGVFHPPAPCGRAFRCLVRRKVRRSRNSIVIRGFLCPPNFRAHLQVHAFLCRLFLPCSCRRAVSREDFQQGGVRRLDPRVLQACCHTCQKEAELANSRVCTRCSRPLSCSSRIPSSTRCVSVWLHRQRGSPCELDQRRLSRYRHGQHALHQRAIRCRTWMFALVGQSTVCWKLS